MGSTGSKFDPETSTEYQAGYISAGYISADGSSSEPSTQGTSQQLKPLPRTLPASSPLAPGAVAAAQTEVMSQQSVLASTSVRTGEKDLARPKILLCEYCDASFTSTSGLWLHKASEHFKRKFVCNICGKVLKRKQNLINHMLTQHGSHARECPACHVYFEPKDIHLHKCAKHKDSPSSSGLSLSWTPIW